MMIERERERERAKHPNMDRKIIEKLTHVLSSNPYIYIFFTLLNHTFTEVVGVWVEVNDNTLHIRQVLLCMGGQTILKQFNLTIVVIIHCLILCSFPTESLDDILKYQDRESP
uniref:Uncharacterized protein n=1 Tax=Lactuca sativa TaxID=4236 RepID=A0A9R1X6M8_LACSA|nr:hypothetical protein LSAT_V11C600309860 [Lactuca sativa]